MDHLPVITVLNTVKPQEKQAEAPEISIPEESKVGKRLGELTTRRVIMLVLGMMFGLPLFYQFTYII